MNIKDRLMEILDGHSIDTPPDVEYVAELLMENGVIFKDSADADISLSSLLCMFNDSQEMKLVFSENSFLVVTPGFLIGMGVGTLLDCKVSHIESTDGRIDIFFRGEQHDG